MSEEYRRISDRRNQNTINFRYVIDSVLITLIAALMLALAQGYILLQREDVRISDIQNNISIMQKQDAQILNHLMTKR